MLLRSSLYLVLALTESIVDHIVRSFTIQNNAIVTTQNDRHPFAHIVKVQDAQQLVFLEE